MYSGFKILMIMFPRTNNINNTGMTATVKQQNNKQYA